MAEPNVSAEHTTLQALEQEMRGKAAYHSQESIQADLEGEWKLASRQDCIAQTWLAAAAMALRAGEATRPQASTGGDVRCER